ncbi:MAG: single-stranded DNA-binding protein [Actinomycetota bacterium]
MAFGNTVTVVGNLTRDPELRYTPTGASVCNFGVAWNKRYQRNGEQVEEVNYFECTCFGDLAENVAGSLSKGTRVVIVGELQQRSWETPNGERRSKVEVRCDEVSPSLRWASVEVTRNERTGAPQTPSSPANQHPTPAPVPDYNYDEEPF